MKILVANLGSTSFKYRLFAMPEEKLLRAAASNGSASEQPVVHRAGRRADAEDDRPGAGPRGRGVGLS